MSDMKKKTALAAKAVQMVYAFPGDLQKGWEAERTSADTFRIHRSNGTVRDISVTACIRTAKGDIYPSIHESGVLMIGDWSVVIGRSINHSLHARKIARPNHYLLFNEKMQSLGQYHIGQDHQGSKVSLVDGHLLKIGDDIVPILPKKHDITLLVMKTLVEDGNLAYMNFIEIGNKLNRRDGAKGILVRPREDGEPALFVEEIADKKVVTARFWLERGDKKLRYDYRDAESALTELKLHDKLAEAKETAIVAGIEPEDYHEYCEVSDDLQRVRSAWKTAGMAVTDGAEIFKHPQADPQHSRQSYYGNDDGQPSR